MQRGGVAPGALAHALRGAAGRGGEARVDLRAIEHAEDRLHDGGLADARTAGHHEERAARRALHREALLLGEHGM